MTDEEFLTLASTAAAALPVGTRFALIEAFGGHWPDGVSPTYHGGVFARAVAGQKIDHVSVGGKEGNNHRRYSRL